MTHAPIASKLQGAHQGYSYQDILVACRLVDLVLDEVAEAGEQRSAAGPSVYFAS